MGGLLQMQMQMQMVILSAAQFAVWYGRDMEQTSRVFPVLAEYVDGLGKRERASSPAAVTCASHSFLAR
jgi:hypothetical protein